MTLYPLEGTLIRVAESMQANEKFNVILRLDDGKFVSVEYMRYESGFDSPVDGHSEETRKNMYGFMREQIGKRFKFNVLQDVSDDTARYLGRGLIQLVEDKAS